jgi:lipopolysaccharide biosynthesis protein
MKPCDYYFTRGGLYGKSEPTLNFCLLPPQFQQIPENDEWWGEGFTEWTNTKKAVPLFEGTDSRESSARYYYDLLEPGAHLWQSEVCGNTMLYGLCYYHYWFNGKMLLEKPIELLLRHREIPTRTLRFLGKRAVDKKLDGGDNSILMPRTTVTRKMETAL